MDTGENAELLTLRDAIADLDRALLELLRRRMDLAAEVGRVKAAAGAAVVVRDAEDRVLTRARRHAEACGVSEQVMEEIFHAIMSGSVERQHRVGVEARRRRGGRILVVGGAGAMGGWLSDFLTLVGHTVEATDPAWSSIGPAGGRYRSLAEVPDLDAYDFVVLAVPLAATGALIDEVAGRRPRGTVVEIASIKTHLGPALARAGDRGVAVSSLHPMFGPGKSPYEPLTFVLACRDETSAERSRIEALLAHPYTRLVAVPFAHHDRLMGWLLGLAHLSGMLFGAALARSGLDAAELRACASTTFTRQAATALSVLGEDPALYLDIQRLNPHREEVYRATRAALDELVGLVAAADLEGFRATLASAQEILTGGA
ncbi:MAG: prephenate dehydrogenase/arogenate dehydrogenase family protein [Thermoanaerobaculaceae bacterium]|nr:prephenate dehydrogenase/arogenate dehydrogenase family protein [Thermoanaerobaculaceae bacterium]TAM56219.1 MAG: prephenate dehydrogenase/arogenate dehydrogenase family protein [Acidobacteriota bacterium]